MTLELWLVYLVASIGLSLAPGPNGMLSLTHGARFGVRSTAYTIAGGALGFFLLIAVSLAGFGAVLAASERVFVMIKWLGAAYLVFLGIRLWLSAPPDFGHQNMAEHSLPPSPIRMFQQGFVVAVFNPKGILFFAAFLPQFIAVDTPYLLQLLVFGGTFVVIEVIYELTLASFAQQVAPWLSRCGHWFNRITGGSFVAMGAALAAASK